MRIKAMLVLVGFVALSNHVSDPSKLTFKANGYYEMLFPNWHKFSKEKKQ
jgi:hypothetical protein